MRTALFTLTAVGIAGLTGCSFLPSAGPSSGQIKDSASRVTNDDDAHPIHYQVIRINDAVLKTLKSGETTSSDSGLATLAAPTTKGKGLDSLFRPSGISALPQANRQVVRPGDILNITIYDSGGGLFGPMSSSSGGSNSASGGGSAVFPAQMVDDGGQVTVPFAGRIQAAGQTTYQIEQEIVAKLRTKAIDPQALVTDTVQNGGNLVTVTGDVKTPLLFPMTPAGARLLDAITAAGGSLSSSQQSNVSVIRGTVARTDSLAEVQSDVKKNILLQSGDTVVVRSSPWTYLAFGAVGSAQQGKPMSYSFGSSDVSMAEAMANMAGGLDSRGILSIYLYRTEQTKFVEQMGIKPIDPKSPTTPVIYLLDLHTPDGFFLAKRFSIRDKDILYVPDADSVGVLKFMNVLTAITAPINPKVATGISGL